jgi:hypothetical protein
LGGWKKTAKAIAASAATALGNKNIFLKSLSFVISIRASESANAEISRSDEKSHSIHLSHEQRQNQGHT